MVDDTFLANSSCSKLRADCQSGVKSVCHFNSPFPQILIARKLAYRLASGPGFQSFPPPNIEFGDVRFLIEGHLHVS